MKSYGTYCPIAKSVEVLGERWSILVLRELLIGATKFNDIARGLPGMSRTMLSKRLREFEGADLVEKLDGEYLLTPAAQELRPIVFGLGAWGEKWLLAYPDPDDLDPVSLMWHAHPRMDGSQLPERRVVVAFELLGRPERFWVVFEQAGCSVCDADPGFEVDVTVRAQLAELYRIFYHQLDVNTAVRAGLLTFEGEKALVRRMPSVLELRPASALGVDPDSPRPAWRVSK
ncbi:MAG: winged helix-turn-helix transcriptional regulator [Acidimicrobiales bacterium]